MFFSTQIIYIKIVLIINIHLAPFCCFCVSSGGSNICSLSSLSIYFPSLICQNSSQVAFFKLPVSPSSLLLFFSLSLSLTFTHSLFHTLSLFYLILIPGTLLSFYLILIPGTLLSSPKHLSPRNTFILFWSPEHISLPRNTLISASFWSTEITLKKVSKTKIRTHDLRHNSPLSYPLHHNDLMRYEWENFDCFFSLPPLAYLSRISFGERISHGERMSHGAPLAKALRGAKIFAKVLPKLPKTGCHIRDVRHILFHKILKHRCLGQNIETSLTLSIPPMRLSIEITLS